MSPTERLRSARLRVTRTRLAVLDGPSEGAHMDADAVARFARSRLGALSTQAVYDILRVRAGRVGTPDRTGRQPGPLRDTRG